jgi:peptidoglycan hydrolase-like protein with peptidoglycan-binding domain
MLKYVVFILSLVSITVSVFPQTYSRVIKVTNPRMNGPDIVALQKRLLELGFSEVGTADGYYGPKTEMAVTNIRKFAGFIKSPHDQSGEVDRALWDFIFNTGSNNNLTIISELSKYNENTLRKIEGEEDPVEYTLYFSNDGKLRMLVWHGQGGDAYTATEIYFLNQDNFIAIQSGQAGIGPVFTHYDVYYCSRKGWPENSKVVNGTDIYGEEFRDFSFLVSILYKHLSLR